MAFLSNQAHYFSYPTNWEFFCPIPPLTKV
jgi:hypothetical protein